MGREINLLKNYPTSSRNILERGESKTSKDQEVAKEFGKEFFDGSRDQGYGGFNYHKRFWENVIPDFQQHWDLSKDDLILDIGCAKGFMLYDIKRLIPGIQVRGIDISEYAIENSMNEVKDFCQVSNATQLPFDDKDVDVSISTTTLHNLDENDLATALLEIERVTKRGSFVP